MRTIDPEVDARKMDLHDWAEARYVQDQLRKGLMSECKYNSIDIADVMERLFREARRLRSLTEEAYLTGFNDGWDECLIGYENPALTV